MFPQNEAPHRLFKIIVDGKPAYYKDRKIAKAARDAAGGGVIMRGPDHWKGESFNVSEQTPSSKKASW